jgi:Vitamin K-dependent gamma-carboxylase
VIRELSPATGFLRLDLRSLAAFRIAIALVVIVDALIRWSDVGFFYHDAGAYPRSMLFEREGSARSWSLHLVSDAWWWVSGLFAAQMLVGLAMLAGWRTRWATVLTWALLISVQSRNAQILQGGDVLMRCLLFWGMFLPLGEVWSMDARRRAAELMPRQAHRLPSAALLIQLACLYLFTGILKWDPAWHRDGNAVWFALALDQFATPVGRWLRQFPELCQIITRGTLAFELLVVVGLFMPWKHQWFRMATMVAAIGFHAGLALCMELGPFPYVAIAGWLVCIPTAWWDRLGARFSLAATQEVERGVRDRLRDAALAVLLVYVVMWNLRTTAFDRWTWLMPVSANAVLEYPKLDQYWAMFAPSPLRDDGWWVAAARLSDGRDIDLLTGLPVNETRPADLRDQHAHERWRKYQINLYDDANKAWRPWFIAALVRRWDEQHPEATVQRAELIFHREQHRYLAPLVSRRESMAVWPSPH